MCFLALNSIELLTGYRSFFFFFLSPDYKLSEGKGYIVLSKSVPDTESHVGLKYESVHMSYVQGLLPQIESCVDEHILLDMFLPGIVYSNSSQTKEWGVGTDHEFWACIQDMDESIKGAQSY